MSIRAKIILFSIITCIVFLLVSVSGIIGLKRISDSANLMYTDHIPLLKSIHSAHRAFLKGKLVVGLVMLSVKDSKSINDIKEYQDQFKRWMVDFNMYSKAALLESESKGFKQLSNGQTYVRWTQRGLDKKLVVQRALLEIQELILEADIHFDEFNYDALSSMALYEKSLQLELSGRLEEARIEEKKAYAHKLESDKAGNYIEDTYKNISDKVGAYMSKAYEDIKNTSDVIMKTVIGLSAFLLLFLLIFALFFPEILIASPLRMLVEKTKAVGRGDLNVRMELKSQDEIGQLADSFNKMVEDLNTASKKEKELTAQAALAAEVEKKRAKELQKTKINLEKHTNELIRSNKELEEFAYIASHDLQEPLRKVKTFGSRLVQKYSDTISEEGKDYLQRMDNAANRMQTLINDLLVYSRVTSKAQPFIAVNLNDIIRDVISDLEISIEDMNAQVNVDNIPSLEADPLQMRQLFQNLVGNALKFQQPGVPPVINIRSSLKTSLDEMFNGEFVESQRCRVITVSDNGIGFEEKYKNQIFAVFQRLHGHKDYKGTGVGLAICRKIVTRHNGTIDVESVPGKGTTFTITLPIIQPKEDDKNQGET